MARKQTIDMSAWPSLTLEGNLIAPAMVAQISAPKDDATTQESYCVRKGLSIREEISTAFRVGQSHFNAFAKLSNPSVEATRRFVRDFLKETFGFYDLVPSDGVVAFVAGERIPVVVVPPTEDKLDRRSPTLSTDRSRSPAFALQDCLNDRDEMLWGLVTNGTLIRLMRDNASLTRPAYIEADLSHIFTNEDAASFSALWLMIHRSRFGTTGAATDCDLERWRESGSREGEAARDRLAGQVELALKILGSGFLEANPELAERLKSGSLNLTDWFNELLRLVYRLIFMMVAEDRNLLHPENAGVDARKLYAEGYSLAALRAQCFRAATWDKHHDRYEGIKIVFRSLAQGQPALGLPALGGLFATDKLPHLVSARLRNKAFMEAIYRLSWLSDKTGMVPANWRAMETEELGSVYESLLELQPQLGADGRTLVFASETAEQKGNQRKTTGSYYTPDSLVQALLDTALDPVLDKTETEADDPAKALLKLSIIDPACGSGHFLLAAARRVATRLARIRADGTPSLTDFRHALRDVARCCIHGVDRNPMAVELTKVALWIETVDPGLPLGFFDAQIRCGDALLGVFDLKVLQDGIPDAAYKPLTGDDKDTASIYKKANAAAKGGQGGFDFGAGPSTLPPIKPFALDFSGFRDLPEVTVEAIGAKAVRFEELRAKPDFVRAKTAADLYVAAFLLPKTGGVPSGPSTRTIPTTEELWSALSQGKVQPLMIEAAKAAQRACAFHWPMEFPDVMQRGGFDVVLGNPPWERIKLQEQEFFAARSPDIASAPNKAARDRLIKALGKADEHSPERVLYDAFISAKREADANSEFTRLNLEEGGRFPLTGLGDINTYGLFAELFKNLRSPTGRTGIIVPAEILSSDASKNFFNDIIARKTLKSAISFENEEFIFPGIANVNRFSLIVLGPEDRTQKEFTFAFYLRRSEHITNMERYFSLSEADIELLNPNTKTCPVFRTKEDAKLTKKIYEQIPILINESSPNTQNAWEIGFQSMFHMSNDSDLFISAENLKSSNYSRNGEVWTSSDTNKKALPLYEGKLIWIYDHRFSSYHNLGKAKGRGGRGLPPVTEAEYLNPKFEVQPRYWVLDEHPETRMNDADWARDWLLGWRDVTSAKLERTFVISVFPRYPAGDKLPLLLSKKPVSLIGGVIANLSSLIFDYFVRQKMAGTSLKQHYLKQFPVIPPEYYTKARLAFIVPKVLELTYTSHSLAPFAHDLGYDGPPFAWNEDRRAQLRADLDAFYARAYGLDRYELRYILDPADVKGPDYPSETFRVLKEKEIKQYGEYRTQRLVLAAWDRMEADGTFAALGLAADAMHEQKPHIELPPLAGLRDGAWAWPSTLQPSDRLRYAAQYALWLSDPTQDTSRMRYLVAYLAEPALLTPHLSDDERANWLRLMGPEAQSAQNIPRLRPQISGAWREMFGTMITSGQLAEDTDGGWIKGQHFSVDGLNVESPHAQRTMFAIQVIRRLDESHIAATTTQEDNNVIWVRFGNGG